MICMMACCDQESCMRNHKTTRHSIRCPGCALKPYVQGTPLTTAHCIWRVILSYTYALYQVTNSFHKPSSRKPTNQWKAICVCLTTFMQPYLFLHFKKKKENTQAKRKSENAALKPIWWEDHPRMVSNTVSLSKRTLGLQDNPPSSFVSCNIYSYSSASILQCRQLVFYFIFFCSR